MIVLIVNKFSRGGINYVEVRDVEKNEYRGKTKSDLYTVGDFVEAEQKDNSIIIYKKYEKPANHLNYYKNSPMDLKEQEKIIYDYIEKIEDENIKLIVTLLISENKENYFTYPAAKSIHHDFIGGIANHVLTMLIIGEKLAKVYGNVDTDLLYAGIILHDFGKIRELENLGLGYSFEGNLVGHLIIASNMLYEKAVQLGVEKNTKIIQLNHILISHHGKLEFGSAKLPMTFEAEIIAILDSLDSKMNIMAKEFAKENTNDTIWTENIFGLDGRKFVKK